MSGLSENRKTPRAGGAVKTIGRAFGEKTMKDK
jgi:hypothetical protein